MRYFADKQTQRHITLFLSCYKKPEATYSTVLPQGDKTMPSVVFCCKQIDFVFPPGKQLRLVDLSLICSFTDVLRGLFSCPRCPLKLS